MVKRTLMANLESMNNHAATEGAAFGTALSQADLVKLQTWFSPSFPIGSFSYSHGLEWVVETGEIADAPSLTQWIAGVLRHGAGLSDAILLAALWRAVSDEDWRQAAEIGALAAALQPTHERRIESLSQGSAFLAAVAAGWPHAAIARFREACPGDVAYPAAVGAPAAAHRLPLDAVLVASLHAFAATLVSAGVRLVPLGQTDGLKIMAALEATIPELAREARSAGVDDIGSSSFLADIASMRHETQYTRLFRS
jgi:urease accessory protein